MSNDNIDNDKFFVFVRDTPENMIDVLCFVRWKYGNPLRLSQNLMCDGEAIVFRDNIQWIGDSSALIIMSMCQYQIIREYTLNHPVKQAFTEIQLIRPNIKLKYESSIELPCLKLTDDDILGFNKFIQNNK